MAAQPYGAWVLQGPSEQRAASAPPPRVRLVCLPPAGAGACFFHGWGAALPPFVEVLPVELPGRNTRLREPKPTDLHALVRDLAAGLAPVLLRSSSGGIGDADGASTSAAPSASVVPFVLLGHSFGAWLAYELALALRRRGAPPPLALYVSANRAPSLAGAAHDPDPLGGTIGTLAPEAFWRRFEARYGVNPELQSPVIRAFAHPLLAADFRCLEAYVGPPRHEPPLECPLIATGAEGDARYRREQVAAWAAHTRGGFTLRWEAPPPHAWATPHRFLLDAPQPFLTFLAADLGRLLAARADVADGVADAC